MAELSVRLDLSIDFRGPAFSLSAIVVIGSGMPSTSANDAVETMREACDAVETMRAACEAVRGRAEECGGITWTGYGDS